MIRKKCFLCATLVAACLALSACAENKDSDGETDRNPPVIQEEYAGVSEETFEEISEFMSWFMTFPVISDFDQQDMSGAVEFFARKWVWTDAAALEYDAAGDAFCVEPDEFTCEMERYFIMSDDALKQIDQKASQGRIRIHADNGLPWGFSFKIDRIEEKEGLYYVHGCNTEVTENVPQKEGFLIGNKTDPFLEFEAVIARNEKDGGLRLKELHGLADGPGNKVSTSESGEADMKELAEFAEVFSKGPVLVQYNVNDLTSVLDFSAQKVLQTHPESVRETDDGYYVAELSEVKAFMEQYFYLPVGYEKSLPKQEKGKDVYPCLMEDGVAFLKSEKTQDFDLRPDPPVVQNERYYRYGVFNVDAEKLRNELTAEGKDLTVIKEIYPFELAVIRAVRGEDGKLRLLSYTTYYL